MSHFKRVIKNNVGIPSMLAVICSGEVIRRRKVEQESFTAPVLAQCQRNQRQNNSYQKYKLESVSVFFRHGARTPVSVLPGVEEVVYDKDIWLKDVSETKVPIEVRTPDGSSRPPSRLEERYQSMKWKGGMYAGMLTTIGKKQAFELGQTLKRRYFVDYSFIDKVYKEKDVFIRSTNVNRCIDSLQCVMAGMFGKEAFKEPLIIPVLPTRAEILFPNFRYCETLKKLEHKTQNYLMEQNGYKSVTMYLKYFINEKDEKKYLPVMNFRDHDVARVTHGLEVPLWLIAIREQVHHWAVKSLETFLCGVPQDRILVQQLVAGPMLHLVVENFESAIGKKKSAKKLSLYSCHDSSLIPLMSSLGIFDNTWPPFCASVHIELFKDQEGAYFVKMAYCDEDITLQGYDSPMIPYEKFREMIAPYVVTPTQYYQRCHDLDLAKEHARKWEDIIQRHTQEEDDSDVEEFPPSM